MRARSGMIAFILTICAPWHTNEIFRPTVVINIFSLGLWMCVVLPCRCVCVFHPFNTEKTIIIEISVSRNMLMSCWPYKHYRVPLPYIAFAFHITAIVHKRTHRQTNDESSTSQRVRPRTWYGNNGRILYLLHNRYCFRISNSKNYAHRKAQCRKCWANNFVFFFVCFNNYFLLFLEGFAPMN